ncbi:MAG: GatB/YqeY domain-containing protein [Chloroflexota bacterium]|nr:GatB/YqeY domain-containing protein [Chloroflexota bacterium]
MTLHHTIEQAARDALRAGDAVRTSTLRMALAAAHNRRIELGRALDDGELVAVLAREAKQRRESIEQFRAGGRVDLAEREEAELAILAEFLPQPLSDDDLERLVREAIVATGATAPRDVGRVMAAVAPQIKGRADGRQTAELVRQLLAGAPADAGPGPVPANRTPPA